MRPELWLVGFSGEAVDITEVRLAEALISTCLILLEGRQGHYLSRELNVWGC